MMSLGLGAKGSDFCVLNGYGRQEKAGQRSIKLEELVALLAVTFWSFALTNVQMETDFLGNEIHVVFTLQMPRSNRDDLHSISF